MHIAFLALLIQVAPPSRTTIVRDSVKPDFIERHAPTRRAVTPELRASAFHDDAARELFNKGRSARVLQDSSIRAYDARVRQRISVKAAVGSVTLERLAYRYEGAARVRWQRGVGAHIEVTGGRVAIPALGMPNVERETLEEMARDVSLVPIPYFPGYEPLWVGVVAARREVNEHDIVNPLGDGAETYYTYRSADSLSIRLADGATIRVRQVDVRPRWAAFNVIVGSLWLDQASGQLVRAAYRLSSPAGAIVSVSDTAGNTNPIITTIVKALSPAMVAQISAVVVEYQRSEGVWLPRSQMLQGFVKATFASVPVTIENSFVYESVNAVSSLPAIHVDSTNRKQDTTSALARARVRKACETSDSHVVTDYKAGGQVPVEMRIPCDLDKLMTSPDLPVSIFDDGEEIFGTRDAERAIGEALSMLDQAPLGLSALFSFPRLHYGVSMTRYNRIEGFSTGLRAVQELGGGVDVTGAARIGAADRRPRLELSLGQTNLRHTIRVGAYDRLVPASDWESPLTFGSSLSAFLFGRDDAFYYTATGVELLRTTERGLRLDWRAFHERQRAATPRASFSVGGSFLPNIAADDGDYTGASVRLQHSRGLDPRGVRLSADLRLEGAGGDSTYGRGMIDLTLSRGFGRHFDAALTAAGGTSVGGLPAQRRWFLGGTQTIRGLRPDTALSGNAFWLGRLELGRNMGFVRPSLFGDVGWAGDRAKLDEVGRPLSGVGVGFSFLDGGIRLDVARGLFPVKQTRLSLYLGARF